MIKAIAKHDVEFADDKGVVQSAKKGQTFNVPLDEFKKLEKLKAAVRAAKDAPEVVELPVGAVEAAPADEQPVAEVSAKKTGK